MTRELVKIVFTVPETDAARLRNVVAEMEATKVGDYTHASFSVKGTGRFKPVKGADPTIGEVGKLEEVAEERIEISCDRNKYQDVVNAIKQAHPYEEPVIDVFPLITEE